MKFLLSAVLLLVLGLPALAGDCVIKTTRTACSGKEKDSYAKCNGQASCEEKSAADSEKECTEKATKACENARPNVTRRKAVSATFDGKPLADNKNLCAAIPDSTKCE
jgi:hypothetical protein